MIYSITGILKAKHHGFAVIEAAGVGYKISCPLFVLSQLPEVGQQLTLLTHHHVREDGSDLYGFITDDQLSLFQSLISVNGVGPKSGMAIMGVAPLAELIAAINEGRADLLTKASGVGRKTAERITLELKGKLTIADTSATIGAMESNADLEETLVSLGYTKAQARAAITKINPDITDFNERLKAALKENKK